MRKFTWLLVLLGLLSGCPQIAHPPSPVATAVATKTQDRKVALAELPGEARRVVALIRAGGPFPYRKDGATFHNRERRLPLQGRGYYREYTVKTPGRNDRGPRRIVAGRQGELYYTEDHYASFRLIIENPNTESEPP